MTNSQFSARSPSFLIGGGEMGERIRTYDWGATPLGPSAAWPQSLLSVLSMMLPSKAQVILFWGPEFVVFYNDACRPVFGARHPGPLGRPGREAWSEIWEGMLREPLGGVLRNGEAFRARDLAFPIERNGYPEDTYFDISCDPVRDESGQVAGVYCVVTETTERVVAGRRMALLRDLAANNATGNSHAEACVLAVQALTDAEDLPFALIYLEDKLVAATPGAQEKCAAAGTQGCREFPIARGGGAAPGKLVVGLNPKRPYDHGYRTFLETVTGQISSAIANSQAYEDERLRGEALREAGRRKDEFLATLAHELRNPLAPIRTAATILATRNLTAEMQQRSAATIARQVGHMARLLDDLLDVARITRGRMSLKKDYVDLWAAIETGIEAARSAIDAKRHTLNLQLPAEPVWMEADPVRIAQIVSNLLNNASKYSDPRATITLSLRSFADGSCELSVEDNGIGMAPSTLRSVFDTFAQEQAALDRTEGGLGIGLALVKGLAELHGGTVHASSAGLGKGSTFTVRLPRSRGATRAALRAGGTEAIEPDEHSHILIADDNQDSADTMAAWLELYDYQVVVAYDGLSAFELARATHPELMLLDIGMPGLNGYELAQKIRGEAWGANALLIAATGWGQDEDKVKARIAGFDAHMTKPLDPEVLISLIEKHLGKRKN